MYKIESILLLITCVYEVACSMEMCNIHVLTQVTAPYSKLRLVKDKNVTILLH